ncbi:MAG: histone deacetylase family protein [Pirellulaceae bacterium]
MKVFYSDTFELPLPENHRFPMSKYRLLRERIAASDEFKQAELLIPPAATDEQILLVHDRLWLDKVVSGQLTDLEERRIGFPWSPKMVERSRRSVGASIAAGRAALDQGTGVNLAGGTHHAFPDAGQGYCVFNDTLVAARVLQQEQLIQQVLFIDLDVHQGNGTAAVARQDPGLFSFSMHCEKNFPFRKSISDLDISLPPGTGDEEFLSRLDQALMEIAIRVEADFVFYLAGADPYEGDRLGQLGLTKQGLEARDRMVFEFCQTRGLPVAVAMAGGYAPEISDIVDIHFSTVRTALDFHALKSAL